MNIEVLAPIMDVGVHICANFWIIITRTRNNVTLYVNHIAICMLITLLFVC